VEYVLERQWLGRWDRFYDGSRVTQLYVRWHRRGHSSGRGVQERRGRCASGIGEHNHHWFRDVARLRCQYAVLHEGHQHRRVNLNRVGLGRIDSKQ